MTRMQRTSPLTVATFAAIGTAVGLLVQFARSTRGLAPLVPPVSIAATLTLIGVVLLVLAIMLHRAVRPHDDDRSSSAERGGPARRRVNPFHAVRLLAGARASQFAGALFAGFAVGLALQLLTRSIMAPSATWLPMVLVIASGIVLIVCGIIAELLCRVPPSDSDASGEQQGSGPTSSGRHDGELGHASDSST